MPRAAYRVKGIVLGRACFVAFLGVLTFDVEQNRGSMSKLDLFDE
jgi:hypothetical protein